MDFEFLCRKASDIIIEVGSFIRKEATLFDKSVVEYKGTNDLVSYVDKTAEAKLVEELGKLIDDAGFITEENTSRKKGKTYNWIIDPLDGTTNFIHSLPCYCISVGLLENDVLVMGIIYEINLKECFYAWKDNKAFLNGKEIHVSDVKQLKDSLLATGFPYTNYSRMKAYMDVFDYCMRNTHGLRRLGSAAADLAYVACGRLEGFYEYGLKPWDVAAGAFILQQAGGKITDFSGEENYLFGQELIATNKNVFDELFEVIEKKFKRK